MSRIAYVQGHYRPHANAYVSIDDRGYQFGDGIYEGIAVFQGRLIDLEDHQKRLMRSLDQLKIPAPLSQRVLAIIYLEVVKRNRITDGFLYVQITRGPARRNHAFPATISPSVVVTCKPLNYDSIRCRAEKGVKAITVPDQRWGRCDIKSINLLPNCLAKEEARQNGAFEAIMIDGSGHITEGTSSNVWMVKEGVLITRSTSDNILAGITRKTLSQLAREKFFSIEERSFTLADLRDADEIFLTGTTSCVMPVITLDGISVRHGRTGPISQTLIASYFNHMAFDHKGAK